MPISKTLIPHKRMVEMPYVTTITITTGTGTGASANHKFRMNSIFDPDMTTLAGDFQPRFHDQAALQYTVYTVVSSSLSVKVINQNQQSPYLLTIFKPKVGGAAITPVYGKIMEMRTGIARRIVTYATGNTDKSGVRLSAQYNKNKHFVSNQPGHDAQRTPFGGNPTNDVPMIISITNLDSPANVITMIVRMTYRVLLSDRIEIGQS